jgi:hypothetical protein
MPRMIFRRITIGIRLDETYADVRATSNLYSCVGFAGMHDWGGNKPAQGGWRRTGRPAWCGAVTGQGVVSEHNVGLVCDRTRQRRGDEGIADFKTNPRYFDPRYSADSLGCYNPSFVSTSGGHPVHSATNVLPAGLDFIARRLVQREVRQSLDEAAQLEGNVIVGCRLSDNRERSDAVDDAMEGDLVRLIQTGTLQEALHLCVRNDPIE